MQFFFLFFFFFSKPNLLYLEPTFDMVGAKHTQTDTHDRYFFSLKSLYLLCLKCGRKISCFLEKVSAANKMII